MLKHVRQKEKACHYPLPSQSYNIAEAVRRAYQLEERKEGWGCWAEDRQLCFSDKSCIVDLHKCF